jgi:hypothetical protein
VHSRSYQTEFLEPTYHSPDCCRRGGHLKAGLAI